MAPSPLLISDVIKNKGMSKKLQLPKQKTLFNVELKRVFIE